VRAVKPGAGPDQVAGGSGETSGLCRRFGAFPASCKSRQTPGKYEQDQAWN
jgi:hypothetical protein